MQLDIIIVGAGLAGLAAANGLRRAGHRVRIFEKSTFANEIGAGITITPNASRILKVWGFSFERSKAVVTRAVRSCDGVTLKEISYQARNTGPEPEMFNVYRPDYHAELWRMAIAEDGEGPPAIMNLGAEVLSADAESGTIKLASGTTHSADLVLEADGIHSKIREVIVPNEVIVKHTGQNAYRFMGSAGDLESNPRTNAMWSAKKAKWTKYDVDDGGIFVWYDVKDGQLQNYVVAYPSEDVPLRLKGTFLMKGTVERIIDAVIGTTQAEIKKSLVEYSKRFHPDLQLVISTGQDIKPWSFVVQEPLRTWIKGKILLVGDAAHPVHPLIGQGVNTAIEDAAALQVLLKSLNDSTNIGKRIAAFEEIRLSRTAIIQIISPVPFGQEATVAERLEPYLKGHPPILSAADRLRFISGYDAFAAAEEALASLSGNKSTGELGNRGDSTVITDEVGRRSRGGCHYPEY